jgi:hypothetical protein
MGTKVVSSSLLSYFRYVANDFLDPLIRKRTPPQSIQYIRSGFFPCNGSKNPVKHLELMDERCSLFELASISQEEVKNELFFMSGIGDARKWHDSLLHTDIDNWDYL